MTAQRHADDPTGRIVYADDVGLGVEIGDGRGALVEGDAVGADAVDAQRKLLVVLVAAEDVGVSACQRVLLKSSL